MAQIADVDVVTNAGAVGRVVVFAVDLDVWPLTAGRLQDQWDEMGFWLVVFAKLAIRVGAGGVEVAQTDRAQSVGAIAVGQHLLDHAFAVTIGVDRLLRMRFVDRDVQRLAKGGSSR